MISKHKVAFFCNPFFGHFNPIIGLVQALTKQGIEVHFYAWDIFEEQITKAGGTFKRIPLQGLFKLGQGKPLSLEVFNIVLKDSMKVADFLFPSVEKMNYDFLIFDFLTLWGRLISYKLELPSVVTYSQFATNKYTQSITYHELRRHLRSIRKTTKLFREFKILRKELLEKFPVKQFTTKDLFANIKADLTIVYSTKSFQPYAETFGTSVHFVGPSFGNRIINEKAIDITGEEPLIYVSLGTVFVKNQNLINRIIDSYREAPFQVIISYAMSDPPDFDNLPDHIKVYKSVDPFQVLKRASVFIHHAGFNSIMESMWFNVPMICFPRTGDQMLNAIMVKRHQVGLLSKDHYSPSKMLRLTNKLIMENSEYRERIKKFSCEFEPYEAGETAAKIILDKLVKKLP